MTREVVLGMAKAAAAKLPPEASGARGSEGARRVLAIMLAFSAEQHTLSARELADATGIALPSVYRYITLLRETGLLAEAERGTFRLSARLIGLARAAEAAESIIEVADPIMRDLVERTGETVILVRLIGRAAVCVHRIESSHRLRTTFEPGQPLPLERGASARVLLTGMPPEGRRQYLAPFAARDPEGFAALDDQVVKAAEVGWAMSIGEIDDGVCAIAAPVRSGPRVLAALTVPSPLTRTPPAVRDRRIAQVRAAASAVGSALALQRSLSGATRSPHHGYHPVHGPEARHPGDGHPRRDRVRGRDPARDDQRGPGLGDAYRVLPEPHHQAESGTARRDHREHGRGRRGRRQRLAP